MRCDMSQAGLDDENEGLRLRPLLQLRLEVEECASVQRADGKVRSVHRFSGGSFDGRISGTVLPGGGDSALVITPDWVEIDAETMLRTDTDAIVRVKYEGLWRSASGAIQRVISDPGAVFNEADHYLRTFARFEPGHESLRWLEGIVAVGYGRKCDRGIEHRFFEIL